MRTFILAATALSTGALAIAGPADAQRATRGSGAAVARPAPARVGGAQANANSIVRAQISANANANARSVSRTVVGGGAQQGHIVGDDPRTWSPTGRQQIGENRRGWAPGRAGRPNMPHRPRWGGMTQGRWYAGYDAPGGWNAYRRPSRGWTLPRYWYAPSFYITDYATYGLGAPAPGYLWTRYYDDAVLVDSGGRVYDSVTGIDWARGDAAYDGGDAGYDDGYAEAYADETVTGGYAADEGDAYDDAGPPPRPGRRDDGVGGAVIGGVVGGVAGNVIAGRGNRLGGTLIGAGVGAIAGAAIDRAEDRGRPAPGYGADYPPPGHGGRGGPPPVVFAPPAEVVQQHHIERDEQLSGYDSRAYTTRSYAHSPYYAPTTTTYSGPGGSTTVVTVTPSVTTTTTTTEFIEEPARVVYRKAAKRTWKPKVRQCTCKCTITCR